MSRSSILHLLVVISLLDGKHTTTDAWSLPLWSWEPEVSTSNASCDPQSCASLDVAQLQEYVAGFNASLPWNETGLLIETMPFGSLASDWTRLLLLQERLPTGTPMRENILRLSRLILAAYFAQEDAALNTESATNYEQDTAITSPSSQTDATPINLEVLQQDDEGPGPQPQPRSFENSAGSDDEAATTSTSTDEIAGSLFTDNGTEAPSTDESPSIVSGNNSAESSGSNEAVHERSREEWKHKEDAVGLLVDLLDKEKSVATEKNLEESTTGALEIEMEKNLTSSEEFDGMLTKSVEDFFAQMSNETEKNSTDLEETTTLDTFVEDFFVTETAVPGETTTLSKDIEDVLTHGGEETVKKSRNSQEATTVDKVVDDFFVTETVTSEESATLTGSEEDFIAQMSNETEKNSTSLEETTTLKIEEKTKGDTLDKTVEDFFANEKTNNSTKITLMRSVNLTSSEEFDTQLTKSVENFFANGSNETLENSTKETTTLTNENSETKNNLTSSEELGALLTESVENFFANGCNETNCAVPVETTTLAEESLEKNSTSLEELTKSVEDFFAQSSNETTAPDIQRAEVSTTLGSLNNEKALEVRSLKDSQELKKSSADETTAAIAMTLDESNATTILEKVEKTQEPTTLVRLDNDKLSESVEKSQEVRLLRNSEEPKNSTTDKTATLVESNSTVASNENITSEIAENTELTTTVSLNDEKTDETAGKTHEVRSLKSSEEPKNFTLDETTLAPGEDNQTSTTSPELVSGSFLTSENSNENVTEDPSTTTLVELISGSFLTVQQENETVTEAPSTSHFEETTESAGEKVTIYDLLEGATTNHDRPLRVMDEVLPTPQPSIMRRVLTTFYRKVEPNELGDSQSKEYDDVQTRKKVPLDALMELTENLQQQPRVGRILGTRTIEQRTRKRPGVVLEPDDDEQYQTFEQTTGLLDEKRPHIQEDKSSKSQQ